VLRFERRADGVPLAAVGDSGMKKDDVDNNIIIASG